MVVSKQGTPRVLPKKLLAPTLGATNAPFPPGKEKERLSYF